MNPRVRLTIFLVGALVLASSWIATSLTLPAFGQHRSAYADQVLARAVAQRNTLNVATAVNFDFRAVDTLGEEFILFASVCGVTMLLRGWRERPGVESPTPSQAVRAASRLSGDAVRMLGMLFVPATLAFGIYLVAFGQLSMGGGFQGGVVIATSALLTYVVAGSVLFGATPKPVIEALDALGAGLYVLIGLASLLAGGAFLGNDLPLGTRGSMLSAGTIPLINAAVGVEVAAGFMLLFREFAEQLGRPSGEDERT